MDKVGVSHAVQLAGVHLFISATSSSSVSGVAMAEDGNGNHLVADCRVIVFLYVVESPLCAVTSGLNWV